jgi:hypothetical protein
MAIPLPFLTCNDFSLAQEKKWLHAQTILSDKFITFANSGTRLCETHVTNGNNRRNFLLINNTELEKPNKTAEELKAMKTS